VVSRISEREDTSMTSQWRLLPGRSVAWAVGALILTSLAPAEDKAPEKNLVRPCSCEVLNKEEREKDDYYLVVLVGAKASKAEILKLLDVLVVDYAGKYGQIDVWNSREAFLRCEQAAAEKKLVPDGGHYLASAVRQKEGRPKVFWLIDGETDRRGETPAREEAERKERLAKQQAKRNEERAEANLKYALKLLDRDEEAKTKQRLREIVEELPDTKAAAEAKRRLREMGEKP
jgi:hypothetical protein